MLPATLSSLHLTITFLCLLGFLADLTFAQHWTLIDDTDPAISYYGTWFQGPCGETCLDPALDNIYNKTWKVTWPSSSSGSSGFSVEFVGYGVLIGGIINDADPGVTMDYSVTLDGITVSSYHTSENNGEITTGAIFFYRQDLEYTTHTLSVEALPQSFFGLDYVGFQDALAPTSSPTPPQSTSSATSQNTPTTPTTSHSSTEMTTSSVVTVMPPETTTTSSTPTSSSVSRRTTSFDTATFTITNIVAHTKDLAISTSVDSSGHTLIPVPTETDGDPPNPTYITNSHGYPTDTSNVPESTTSFPPGLAGAIGAAGAATAAVLIIIFIFCLRKRREARRRLRPSDAEPYILAPSTATPSTANSNLSPPLSPMPYSSQSVLGLYTTPGTIPDQPRVQLDLLASPPPNTLSAPMSPNQPYSYPVANKIISSSSRQPSRRASDIEELRSPVTPLTIQRPNDWDIEGVVVQNQNPTLTVPSSPMVPTPSPHSSRRRRRQSKEPLESIPPPPLSVPILRQPHTPRRIRRETTEGMFPSVIVTGEEAHGLENDEDPVLRRQSFSHPAPPAYSPPRLVRNADLVNDD